MARYDPFEEMDRMFEQLRTRVWTPEGSYGTEGRFGTDFGRFGGDFEASALARGREDPTSTEGMASMTPDGSVNMDLTKREDEYVFVADLPGFEREEIDLTFDDGVLTVIAEREATDERTGGDEIAVRGRFARSHRVAERMTIPAEVADEDISATYRNGVLEVHFPIIEDLDDEGGKKIDIAD